MDKPVDNLVNRAVGPAIRFLRQTRNWEQRDLGEKLGCAAATVSQKETGRRGVSRAWRERFARAFGMTLEQFDSEVKRLVAERPIGFELNEERDAAPPPIHSRAAPKPAAADLSHLGDVGEAIAEWCRQNGYDPQSTLAAAMVAFQRMSHDQRTQLFKAGAQWLRTGSATRVRSQQAPKRKAKTKKRAKSPA